CRTCHVRWGAAAALRRWISMQPILAARLEGAEQRTAPIGMAPLASSATAGVMPGAVLLGDAAGFLDPITGGGMAQALLTAGLVATYLVERRGDDDAWFGPTS